MKPIAHIRTDLPQKFGIPRNSFLAPHLQGRIVFEPEFALNSAVAGLDGFSHAWLLWEFENGTPGGTAQDIAADAVTDDKSGTNTKWSPTVRPPRLGGSERMGVFATRSPFRPNPIGLTCVKIDHVELTDDGPIIHVLGADLRDGTPIFDIKPYIPFALTPPRCDGRFHRRSALARTRRRLPRNAAGTYRGRQARGSRGGAAPRPAPRREASTTQAASTIWPLPHMTSLSP